MNSFSRASGPRRRTATVLAAALIGSTFAVGFAHADTVTSGYDTSNGTGTLGPAAPGDAITRAQILARADDWVNQDIPYSQTAGWEDSAAGGPYREDCSGFVSMAWGLPTSMVTSTLPSVSTVTDSNLSGDTNINQGDALDYTADHVVLFDSWIDQSSGTFYYDAEHTYGQVANQSEGSVYDSSLEGYSISDFEVLQYNHITTTAPAATTYSDGSGGRVAAGVHSDGRVEVFAVTPSGGIDNKYETTADGAWSGWNGFGPTGTAVAVAVGRHEDGRLEVFAVMSDGSIENKYETTADGNWSGWNDFAPAGTAVTATVGVHADGRLEVFAVNSSGGVQNKFETTADGSWSGWSDFGPSGEDVKSITAARHADGRLEVFASLSNGAMENKYELTGDGNWSGWNGYADASTVNSTGEPGVVAAGVHEDGRVEVFVVTPSGGIENKYETTADGAWSGFNGFGPSGTVEAVATARHADGRLEVFAIMSNGSMENKYETTADGSWSGWNSYAPSGTAHS